MDIRLGSGTTSASQIADLGHFSGDVPTAAVQSDATPVQTVNAVQQAASVPDMGQTKEALKSLNEAMKSLSQGLEFSMDGDINRTIVKVVDTQTNQVIRQMPTQEAVEISKALDRIQGLLIKQQA